MWPSASGASSARPTDSCGGPSPNEPGRDDGAERVRDDEREHDGAQRGDLPEDVEDRRADDRDRRGRHGALEPRERTRAEEHVTKTPRRRRETDREDRDEEHEDHAERGHTDLQRRGHAEGRAARRRRDVPQEDDPRQRGRGKAETEHRETRQQDAHLSSPSAERRAVCRDDTLVRDEQRRRGHDEHQQEARGVARGVGHVALQRHDRGEGTDALLDVGDAPGGRRRRVAQIEEDARSRRRVVRACRRLGGQRPNQEDRGQAEGDDERAENETELASRHRATVRLPVPLTRRACAAKAQATPRRASAMTVSPSTKKNASVVSVDAAVMTFPMARAKSSPWTRTWRARKARLGSAKSSATMSSQVTRGLRRRDMTE